MTRLLQTEAKIRVNICFDFSALSIKSEYYRQKFFEKAINIPINCLIYKKIIHSNNTDNVQQKTTRGPPGTVGDDAESAKFKRI